MNAPSPLSSLYFSAASPALGTFQETNQQSKPKANSTVTILPAPSPSSVNTGDISSCSPVSAETPASSSDGYSTPTSKLLPKENQTQNLEMPSPSPWPLSVTGKRKRLDMEDELTSFLAPTPTKRKGSSDFLRKGQWTNTEERLARLLIEAFEDGYLPIYTGIRLRGYLAVQLQCDPMRVSKKLCAGTIDGKPVPKNYGQKKFKLRKKPFWDCEDAESRITELESLTEALWSEARMKKPSFLTLSSTRNVKRRGDGDDDDDSMSSPPSPAKGRAPSSTPKSKKQKVFPIIYLNLSKKLKHYSVRGLDSSSSGSEPASPSNDSDSDSEPVRLDGESLQAAYDLLTLCSPRGSSSKGKSKKRVSKKRKDNSTKDKTSTEDATSKETSTEEKSAPDKSNEDKSEEHKATEDESSPDDAPSTEVSVENVSVSKAVAPNSADISKDLPSNEISKCEPQDKATDPVSEPQPLSEDLCIKDLSSILTSST
ncbi:hypothetical protein PF005_g21894 [Phytophthora fragariae]|uniref:Uncharacterized protein n=1 Tax=Phytophthora fragariae TaxID=53985 RepID=A0A6A3IPM4_9STRA|nr:hypothetical protein PF003_g12707 [Phytophthora fragariae]KAE8927044.1 hypothetical protein PF009_g22780 [Phytophthora fragariae]KAE8984909.1 hypothetical protein PF011_g20601 [Phytophthora fragariae]KAE9083328.1 hypothetical protein PF007_g21947 [Phytophthora fragariae]KAE9083447.1 hypothetical protein PF010_g21211 [Phytophthora fragariae]